MSFDLAAKRLAWLPVKWKGFASSGDEPGQVVEHEIEVQVELVEREEFARLFVQPDPEAEPDKAAQFNRLTDLERFNTVASNWRKVVAGTTSIPFNPENVAKLMGVPNFPLAFFQSYANAWQAIPETRAGN